MRMTTAIRHLVVPLAFLAVSAGPAIADAHAEKNIRTLADKLRELDAHSVAVALIEDVDVDRTARFVLGRHLQDVPPEDVAAFTARFSAYLAGFIESRADEIASGDLEILSSHDRNDHDCIVSTAVHSPTRERAIMRWRLLRIDGAWHIVDVEMHGVWLAIEQRAQIDSLLDQDTDISTIYAEVPD